MTEIEFKQTQTKFLKYINFLKIRNQQLADTVQVSQVSFEQQEEEFARNSKSLISRDPFIL